MKLTTKIIESKYTLPIGLVSYVILLTVICWYKYSQFGYNALDLAIYNNAFFNATQTGNFWSSIQGHHYFADHFEPLLYILLPLYWLWRSPLNLLLMQSIIIASTSLPIYLLAKNLFTKKIATLLGLIWLINPLAWNINLHEWHLLPLAIPLILTAYYFYEKKSFWLYFGFTFMALLVREDVAVAIFGFFLLAVYEKKSWRWWLTPLLLSSGYFLLANWIINLFASGGLRFQIYYQWLMETNIWQIFLHFFTLGNFEMLLGLLLAFLFLPLFAKKYLLLLIGPLAQFMLGEPGGSNLIVDTHYSSLFIPTITIASLYGLKNLLSKKPHSSKFIFFDSKLTILVVVAILIYLPIFLGPGFGIIKKTLTFESSVWQKKLLDKIPNSASVASGYKYLPYLSSRNQLSSLHYIFIGKQQFSYLPYEYTKPDYLVIDPNDFITYALQFPNSKFYQADYPDGFTNLQKLIDNNYELIYFHSELMIWKKSSFVNNFEYVTASNFEINQPTDQISENIKVESLTKNNLINLAWNYIKNDQKNYFLQVSTGQINSYIRPLVYFTPTLLWSESNTYHTSLPYTTSDKPIKLQLVTITGNIELDGWRGIKNKFKTTQVGETFTILPK
jgi:uncharacterized membrane protein